MIIRARLTLFSVRQSFGKAFKENKTPLFGVFIEISE